MWHSAKEKGPGGGGIRTHIYIQMKTQDVTANVHCGHYRAMA